MLGDSVPLSQMQLCRRNDLGRKVWAAGEAAACGAWRTPVRSGRGATGRAGLRSGAGAGPANPQREEDTLRAEPNGEQGEQRPKLAEQRQ